MDIGPFPRFLNPYKPHNMNELKHPAKSVPSRVRPIGAGLFLVGLLTLAGCERSSPPAAEQAPAAAPETPAAPGGMRSNVPVKGDEALPPSHPPLPAAMPPHPTEGTDSRPDLDQRLAAEHPQASGSKQLSVVVPDSVKARWTAATLAVRVGGSEKEIKLAIGAKATLGSDLQLQLLHYLPAYTSNFQMVTSSSSDPLNPAVQIAVLSKGQVLAEGWVFQNLPDFNSFKSEQVHVRLVSGESAATK
jgi:hypothetical protein